MENLFTDEKHDEDLEEIIQAFSQLREIREELEQIEKKRKYLKRCYNRAKLSLKLYKQGRKYR